MLGRRAVAHDQGRAARPPGRGVWAERLDGQAVAGGPGDHVGLTLPGRQFDQRMQAGRDTGDPHVRGVPAHRGSQPVPSPPVGEPGPAHVPVIRAGRDELGQGQLVEGAALPVGQVLGRGDVVDQMAGQHQPAEAESRGQALAGRAGVDDVFGREALHGADRLAVVAELAVVVVLDDHSPGVTGPLDHPGAPLRRERHPERKLVRRGQKDRAGRADLVHHGAAAVDRKHRQPQAGGGGHGPVTGLPVGLHRERRDTPRAQHLAQQRRSLGESGAHHDPAGTDAYAPGTREVLGQGLP